MDLGLTPTLTVQGVTVPTLIYGTAWKEDETAACVSAALDAGFRGIDTANQRKHYHEAGVGEALAPFLAKHPRDALFLQTKYTYARGQDHRLPYDPALPPAAQVPQSVASSRIHLRVECIDSLVLHGPESREGLTTTDRAVWRAMEAAVAAGQARLLGVSNVSATQLADLHAFATIKPTFVQNRCYASTGWDAATRAFCRQQGLIYQGFSLLTANRSVWNHKEVAAIARREQATPAQVILRFAQHIGILPLTGTTDPAHMRADLDLGRVRLSADEIARIERLG